MVLKGLALGSAVATLAIAIFVALTFQPAPAKVTAPAPASNVVVLPNGMAAPQLQPQPQSAPVIVESETSLVTSLLPAVDGAKIAALSARESLSTSTNAVEKAVHSCGGDL